MGNTQNKANDNNPNSGSTNSVANTANPVNVGQTQLTGQKNTSASFDTLAGARNKNILSKLSSYTYGISLYICTPEAYNSVFPGNNTGRMDKSIPGIYIVAQSGGINNTSESRALTYGGNLNSSISGGNAGYDYYIDDLSINTEVPGGTNVGTVSTALTFKIMEPIGFKFLSELSKASDKINETSEIIKRDGSPRNRYQQCYILGISFHGYDVNGNLVKASDPLVSSYNNGYGSDDSIIQRFFPIQLNTVNFKLGGGPITYHCEAAILNQIAGWGEVNAVTTKPTELIATTVREAIEGIVGQRSNNLVTGLLQVMNEEKKDQQDRELTKLATTYRVQFEPDAGIDTAKILDDKEVNARIAPMASVATTKDATVSESVKVKAIDTIRKKISISQGQNLAMAIDNIIVKSSYVTDALTEVNSSTPEAETESNTGVKKLSWYTVTPIVKIIGSDPKTNQWAYDINYVIRKYKIPYIRTQFKQMTEQFYGAVKQYNYWLTGANTEVLGYEQSYNNLFYVATPISTTADGSAGDGKQGYQTPTSPQGGVAYNSTSGKTNRGSDINAAVASQVYSLSDQAEADIKILGDPDFLMTQIATPPSFGSFFGNDKSIDPMNGQIFIELIFKTAADYKNDGLLDVNENINFYPSGEVKKRGIKGTIFRVLKVQSSFSRGQFTQQLHCSIVPESELVGSNTTNSDSGRVSATPVDRDNKTIETQQRSGVDLTNARAGGGRGGQGGPTAQQLAGAAVETARDDQARARTNTAQAEAAANQANQTAREQPTNQEARIAAYNARLAAQKANLQEINVTNRNSILRR